MTNNIENVSDTLTDLVNEISAAKSNIKSLRKIFSKALNEIQHASIEDIPVREMTKLACSQLDAIGALDKINEKLDTISNRAKQWGEPINFDIARQEIIDRIRRIKFRRANSELP